MEGEDYERVLVRRVVGLDTGKASLLEVTVMERREKRMVIVDGISEVKVKVKMSQAGNERMVICYREREKELRL